MATNNQPVIVILGPTASGKTGVAIELAKEYDGEIICADSRTIYKDMDIGTAKPTMEERAGVIHWGLDLVSPNERFSVAAFKQYADKKITEIRERGKLPIIVGGTGLYLDAVIFDYKFPMPLMESEQVKLEAMSVEELIDYCNKNNVSLPRDATNKRRLVTAIRAHNQSSQRRSAPFETFIIVGIATDKDTLAQRISARTEHMFDNGVVEEATILGKKYGWDSEAMTSNIYRVIKLYLENELTNQQARDKFTTLDRQLAKRQMTWFRRNPFIQWCQLPEVEEYVKSRLVTEYNS